MKNHKEDNKVDNSNNFLNSLKEILPELNSFTLNEKKFNSKLQKASKLINCVDDIQHFEFLVDAIEKKKEATSLLILNFLLSLFKSYSVDEIIAAKLLCSKKELIRKQVVANLLILLKENKFSVKESFINQISECIDSKKENSLNNIDLKELNKIIIQYSPPEANYKDSPLLYLYLKSNKLCTRILAAKLLDLENKPIAPKLAKLIVGKENYQLLADYLIFSCASYMDLLSFTHNEIQRNKVLVSINDAQKKIGKEALKEIITQLGWQKINNGFKLSKLSEIVIENNLPIYISDLEAEFLKNCVELKKLSDVVVVKGLSIGFSSSERRNENSPILRFKNYNLNHAKALKEILDIAPLSKEKIEKIISLMDCIVNDYILLFDKFSDECSILHEHYKNIKFKIFNELQNVDEVPQLSPNLTRLVQMFEEAKSIAETTTLHGLKRYLHQKGLKLGFKLVDNSKTPDKSVNLLLTRNNKIVQKLQNIHYAEFEPSNVDDDSKVTTPYPIKVVHRGIIAQMLYGLEQFPKINIFCYGNEIHYYVWFRNHPIFIRIDFSPPLQGGMIDLEYYGVSNYEIDSHPNLELHAVRSIFEKLEFDVTLEGTRIHARFDKERTIDLGELCRKAEYLFRFVPFMMDFDWIIEALNYNKKTKRKIIDAWAESFLFWGVIPVKHLLNNEKNKILFVDKNNGHNIELPWNGEGEYKDKYFTKLNRSFYKKLKSILSELEINIPKISITEKFRQFGKIELERNLLRYIRESLASGEIVLSDNYFFNSPPELFKKHSPIELFVNLFRNKDKNLYKSAQLAKLIIQLEQTLTFQTIGYIKNYKIEETSIPLLGNKINVYVLRERTGIIILAIYSLGNRVFSYRKYLSDTWQTNWSYDVNKIASLLSKNNYVISFPTPSEKEINSIIDEITFNINFGESIHIPFNPEGEKLIYGLTASPGKATGKALLGIDGRSVEDFKDAILIASSISPNENSFIYTSVGVVSTGGGILSHAGLIALQFKKPSIIIEGKWINNPGGTKCITYKQLVYKQRSYEINGIPVTERYDLNEEEHILKDGDIVVLDASNGYLQVLGQSAEVLLLFDCLKNYGELSNKIFKMSPSDDILSLRGKLIKTKHQLKKVLTKLSDQVLIRYAIYELLIGDLTSKKNASFSERLEFLKILLAKSSDENLNYINTIISGIYNNFLDQFHAAEKSIIKANYLNDIISKRLKLIETKNLINKITNFLSFANIDTKQYKIPNLKQIDKICLNRLEHLFKIKMLGTEYIKLNMNQILSAKHLLRQLKRIGQLIQLSEKDKSFISDLEREIAKESTNKINLYKNKYTIEMNCAGLELIELIGGKGANLGEISQLLKPENIAPWFAVSNYSFQTVLDYTLSSQKSFIKEIPTEAKTVREAIDIIVNRRDLTNKQKSDYIAKLWDWLKLPNDLVTEIVREFNKITSNNNVKKNETYFAVRSSSLEEDAEISARAGEFETFLFVNGIDEILKYLKKTWSGLWTERAIHNRLVLGSDYNYQGGVIVQKIIWSRVSGVIQTINISKMDSQEIVINAGLGLGEGIVSGIVGTDQIIVTKNNDYDSTPLNFNYITSDKKEQVVFDSKNKKGTTVVPTLYHQRFRAALEYVEILELVKLASHLESEYGYPLDIEFAIENSNIFILQVRPVATFLPAFEKTIKKYPLKHQLEEAKND